MFIDILIKILRAIQRTLAFLIRTRCYFEIIDKLELNVGNLIYSRLSTRVKNYKLRKLNP